MAATAATAATVATAGAITAIVLRCTRLVVEGDSMRPTLEPGDRLLVIRTRRLRLGQVVVIRDPRQADRLLVKRVSAIGPTGLSVRGDNEAASTDSREFGALPRGEIVGRAFYRYAPAARTGLVPVVPSDTIWTDGLP
jgi:nickel-type superoxide dismutase maturation protease